MLKHMFWHCSSRLFSNIAPCTSKKTLGRFSLILCGWFAWRFLWGQKGSWGSFRDGKIWHPKYQCQRKNFGWRVVGCCGLSGQVPILNNTCWCCTSSGTVGVCENTVWRYHDQPQWDKPLPFLSISHSLNFVQLPHPWPARLPRHQVVYCPRTNPCHHLATLCLWLPKCELWEFPRFRAHDAKSSSRGLRDRRHRTHPGPNRQSLKRMEKPYKLERFKCSQNLLEKMKWYYVMIFAWWIILDLSFKMWHQFLLKCESSSHEIMGTMVCSWLIVKQLFSLSNQHSLAHSPSLASLAWEWKVAITR